MTHGPGDQRTSLSDLLSLPPDDRRGAVSRQGDVSGALQRLSEEAEALAFKDLKLALKATDALVTLAGSLGDPVAQAHAHRARGRALAYANRYDESIASFRSAIEWAGAGDCLETAARSRMAMVHPLTRVARYDEAIAAGESAVDAFTRLGHEESAAKANVNVGVTHRMRGDPQRAIRHFDRARAGLGANPVSVATLETNRADALLELGRFQEAESAFRAALDAYTAASVMRGAAIVEGNLADLLSRQGRLEHALLHFERARRQFEQDQDAAPGDLARLQAEQAEAYAAAGMLPEAADAYEKALEPLAAHGLTLEAARAWAGLGRVLTELGAHERAEAALAEAARRFDALPPGPGRGRVALVSGELALSRGDLQGAQARLDRAAALLADHPAELAAVRHRMASIALERGDADRARANLEPALADARAIGLPPLVADLLHARARLNDVEGRGDLALADLREAIEQIERIRGSLQADRMRAAFLERRTAVYEDLVARLADAGEPAEAFHTVERAKARALLDIVAGALRADVSRTSAERADGPLVAEVLRTRGELNALYARPPGLDEQVGAGAIESWRRQIEVRERAVTSLEARLGATSGLGGLFAATARAEAVQGALPDDTALIEYYHTDREVMAFVVRPGALHLIRRLSAPDDLEEAVERCRFQIERAMTYPSAGEDPGLVADARRELERLGGSLVAPLAGAVEGAERLVIVPHGLLHQVPFHALVCGGRHLVERYELLTAPSASLYLQLPGAWPGGDLAGRCLVVGVADEAAPHIAAEIDAIAEVLPEPVVLTGERATREAVMEQARGRRLIHLACHGRFVAGNPLASGLLLGDGWLTVRDLYDMRLDGAAVVLSGCDTGRIAQGGGEEATGLLRGFFAAGAASVVMSQWALHDETAGKNLVASLYRLWHNGPLEGKSGLGSALRRAQTMLIHEGAHPAVWAPLFVAGKT